MQNGLVEDTNGSKEWYLNGEHHRVDGPAVELADGCLLYTSPSPRD